MKEKVKERTIISKVFNIIKRNVIDILGYLKTNVLFFTFVITSLINGWFLRTLSVKNTFDISPLLADLAVILLIGSIGYLFKPKHQFKYFMTWSIIFTAVCLINAVYYNNYFSFVSFSLIKVSSQLGGMDGAVVTDLIDKSDFLFLFQIVAMLFVNKYLKMRKYYDKVSKIEIGKERLLNTMVMGLIVLGFFISTLTSTDVSRLNKQWNRDYVVTKFGIYVYQFNDLFATLKSQINPLFGYDQAAKTFREYYNLDENGNDISEYTTSTNDYTNIFKGKNVIVIHAESIQNFLLDTQINGQDITPNLKKLASEGLYFSNFHAQESVGTSSDTEFTFSTSLLPATSGTVSVNYFDRDYVSVQKLFKDQGYYVYSMHGNNCSFWNRSAFHKSLGYDDFYCYNKDYDIDEKIGLGLSDKSFFRQSTDIISRINSQNKKWYGTLIMLSNHTPFNTNGVGYSDFDVTYHYTSVNEETGEETDAVAPFMDGTKLGYYFKSAHYADEALGEYINEMDEAGLLDNTVVIIYGDHDAKIKKSEYVRFYNYDYLTDDVLDESDPNYVDFDNYAYELNREVPLIIWTKDSKYKAEITEAMGMIDVLPTIGNMFGISDKYALGTDIFSLDEGQENVVVFPDGNWLTNTMYYSRSKAEAKLLDVNSLVSEDYISKNNEYADKIISVSDSIIVHDLIKKITLSNNLISEETN